MPLSDPLGRITVVSTPAVPGRRSVRPCGVVTGTAVVGTHLLNDLLACVRDAVGGRARVCESTLTDTAGVAVSGLCRGAQAAGADAVVGLTLDVEVGGERAGMMVAPALGTAVATEPDP